MWTTAHPFSPSDLLTKPKGFIVSCSHRSIGSSTKKPVAVYTQLSELAIAPMRSKNRSTCLSGIIPVNLTKGEPHVFRSAHLPEAVHDKDIKIAEAIIATTAAPTYFPHRQIGDDAFVDGGVWAADPSMLAIAEAIRVQQLSKQLDPTAQIVTNDIHLLSVGTGRAEFSLSPPGADAGLLFWASRIADVMGLFGRSLSTC